VNDTPELDASGSHAAGGDNRPPAVEFVSLFLANQRGVYRYILSLIPTPQDAEDLLQETAEVLWRRFAEFQPGSSFFAWACQIAHYKVLEFRRRQGREALLLDDDVLEQLAAVAASKEAPFDVRRSALDRCLAKLSSKDRTLLERRYSPQGSSKQIAVDLGRPANSISKSLGRIRRTLLDCIRRAIAAAEREGGSS
jgi:RNA polymerase sigma-70 factor (ECF subfamily)